MKQTSLSCCKRAFFFWNKPGKISFEVLQQWLSLENVTHAHQHCTVKRQCSFPSKEASYSVLSFAGNWMWLKLSSTRCGGTPFNLRTWEAGRSLSGYKSSSGQPGLLIQKNPVSKKKENKLYTFMISSFLKALPIARIWCWAHIDVFWNPQPFSRVL